MPTINDTIARLNQAWNHGDATAYAATFTPDATYIVFDVAGPDGEWLITTFHNTRRGAR
jgi:hypothetical protein